MNTNDATHHARSCPARPTPQRWPLLALLLLVPAPTLGVVAGMVLWPGAAGQGLFIASKVWIALLPVVWLLLIERKRISLSPARCGGFGVGVALGAVIAGIIFAAYVLFAHQWIDADTIRSAAQKNGLADPVIYIIGATYWITLNSLMEEYIWRWYVVEKCEGVLPARIVWLAIPLSALFFTLHHIAALMAQHLDWKVIVLANLGIFLGGCAWAWLYRRYRSIWPAYVSHAIVDIPIFVIGWRLIFSG